MDPIRNDSTKILLTVHMKLLTLIFPAHKVTPYIPSHSVQPSNATIPTLHVS